MSKYSVKEAHPRDVLVFLKFCKILVSARFYGECSVVFHALTLKLPIQTSLSVAPELPVSLRSGEKCQNFRKTSTLQVKPSLPNILLQRFLT